VVLRSNPGQALAGKVARVEAVSDSVTEERVAQVGFDQAPAGLSVGELAEVTLSLPATASAVLLPNAAIKRLQAQVGVWVIDDGTLRFAPVRIGQASLDGQVQILEGLKAGTTVIVHSEKDLGAHSRITVVGSLAGRQP
jgi:HlyD family secretion protein